MQTQSTQLSFSGQNIYVGIDKGKKNFKVTLFNDHHFLKTFSQDPNPDVLYNYLCKHYPEANYQTAYEAGFSGFWVHERLTQLGVKSIVVNPADIPTTDKEKKQKTDKRDSLKIARELKKGELQAIYVPSKRNQQDRGLVRLRSALVRDLCRYKLRIKSYLDFYGIQLPDRFKSQGTHWSRRFMQWLESIEMEHESGKQALMRLIQESKRIRESVLDITRQIRALSRTDPYAENVRLLTTVPGISHISAMTILTELETIKRFKNIDKLCAYVGLIPSTYSTGDNDVIGDITPRRNRMLRSIFVECAWVAMRTDPALTMKYNELCKRMKGNEAIIRIAKKLVKRMTFVLLKQREYTIGVVE